MGEQTITNTIDTQEVKTEKINQRSCWVDTAKAFGIFLVFLGHIWYLSDFPLLNQMIYSFHVLAFFILSGYVIKRRKEKGGFLKFVWKKFKRLLLPAIVCTIITLPLYFLSLKTFSTIKILKRIFFWEGLVAYNDPLWFLIVMFETVVIERLLKIKDKNVYIKALYFFVFIVAGFLVYRFDIFLPFGLNKMLICLAFLVLGILLRELIDVLKNNIKTMNIFLIIAFVVSVGLWFLFGVVLNPKASIYYMTIGNYWHFCLSGLFGSAWYFIICYGISKLTKFFERVSKPTILILGTHYIFTRGFRRMATSYNFAYTWVYSVTAFIYTILIIALYVLTVMVIKKITNKYKIKKEKETV